MAEDYKSKIEKAFNQFNGKNPEVLESFYSRHVQFQDPVVKLEGLEALKKYYAHAYQNVSSIHFSFHEPLQQGRKVFAPWTMTLQAKSLNGGKPFEVDGGSHFEFDENQKVQRHRDYVDLGAMVYEKLPLQGGVIRLIKKLLTPKNLH